MIGKIRNERYFINKGGSVQGRTMPKIHNTQCLIILPSLITTKRLLISGEVQTMDWVDKEGWRKGEYCKSCKIPEMHLGVSRVMMQGCGSMGLSV